MPNVFGQPVEGNVSYNVPAGVNGWQSLGGFGDLNSWFSNPDLDPAQRQWAVAYELMPYLAPSSQRALLGWMVKNMQDLGSEFSPYSAQVQQAWNQGGLGGGGGLSNQQYQGPMSLLERARAQQNALRAARAAGQGLSGTGTPAAAWLQGLSAPQSLPTNRNDWDAYNMQMANYYQDPDWGNIFTQALMPAVRQPNVQAFQASNTGWWR